MIPAMEEEGYSQETSVGVTAASSTIGIVIPPSIPMVVYSSVAGASIGALFLGGVVLVFWSVLDRCLLFLWEIRNIIIQNRIQCHLKTS